MDRLRNLKVPDLDSSYYSNTSQAGYETAIDDSDMSLYFSMNNGNGDGDGDNNDNNDDGGWKDLSSASSVIIFESNEEETLMNSMAGGGDSVADFGSGNDNDFTMTDANTNDISMKNVEQLESDDEKDVSSLVSQSIPTEATSITAPTDSLVSFLIEEEKSLSPTNTEIDFNPKPLEFNMSKEMQEMINKKPITLQPPSPSSIIQQSFDENSVSTIIKSPSWSPQAISNHILSQSSFNEVQRNIVDMSSISKITANYSHPQKNDNLTTNILNHEIICENKENQQQRPPTTSRSISYNINKRRTILRLSGIMESPAVTTVSIKKSSNHGDNENSTSNKNSVTIGNKPITKYSLAARKFVVISPKPTTSSTLSAAAATGAIPKIPNRRTNIISASPKIRRTSNRRSTAILNNISASPKPVERLSTRRSTAAFNFVTAPPKPIPSTLSSTAATVSTGAIPKNPNRRTTTFNVISTSPKLLTNRTSKRRSTAVLNNISALSQPVSRLSTRRSIANFNIVTVPSKPSLLSTTTSSKRQSTAKLNVACPSPKYPKTSSTEAATSLRPAKRRSTVNFNVLNATANTIQKSIPSNNLNRRSIRKSVLNLQPPPSTSSTTTNLVTIKQKSPYKFRKPSTFNCKICNKSFLQLSKLNAHEKVHNNNNNNLKSQSSAGIINSCQYCDKQFAIKSALDKHLQENCDKISSVQRRKLLFQVRENQPKSLQQERNSQEKQYRRSQRLANTLSNSPLSDCSSVSNSSTPHAHSGIYRTPNKKIICHQCNISFPNMISFLEHTETHPQNQFET